jgi:hypothetical protein
MNPNSRPERWEKIRAKIEDAFVRHMGSDVVDARLLCWGEEDADPSVHVYDGGPWLLKVEMWRLLEDGRALRFNCVQNIRNGDVRVVTADLVSPDGADDSAQRRCFVEQVLACDVTEPVWSSSIEGAIAAHDDAFDN